MYKSVGRYYWYQSLNCMARRRWEEGEVGKRVKVQDGLNLVEGHGDE
jgi:hypothetical protein